MHNKKLKYLINSSVIIVGAIVVTILLNTILVTFDDKMSLEINLTKDEIYELTDETNDIVDQIDQETTITVLYDGQMTDDMMLLTNIIDKYAQRNENIKMESVDFLNNPTALAPYSEAIKNISNPYYAMIFTQGDQFDTAEASSYISTEGYSNIERIITNKLATFVDGYKISSITLTTGHGEKSNSGFESVLSMYNYTVNTVDLLNEDLPEDEKTLVVINAPTGDFSAEEIEKLDAYLDRGGNVQIYFDPLASNEELPRLESYLADEWAIVRNHGVVVDMPNKLESASETAARYGILAIAALTDSEIVSPIQSSQRSILYSASNCLEIAGDKPGTVEITPVLQTSNSAYLKDVSTINESQTSEDPSGTFDILVAATRKNYTLNEEEFTGKLIVSGSGYTMDTLIGDTRFANEDLLLNSINWMRGSEAGITVRAKELPQGSLTLPNSQFWPWFIALVVIIPVGLCIWGVVVWMRRRYK